ncbi:ribosomal protein S18-alanine N-acetyltransferase [Skermania piniformis]|uniref:Ribosomal protein S18-alanine N-acetyltransferase n=1 Tax=Skermania pinensis TaxID=39122 RepID=A0ABX8SDX4_9ACTN|nr:ribosomal protein S18-alanine N-acetyltransferase [Skermania piniformis]QXQ14640.1 ribosomal protein S18-alanine N-acetyltransferase [Skermania piniformis]
MIVPAAGVRIDPLTSDDIPDCVVLERLLFAGDSPWTDAAFAGELAGRDTRYFAARAPDAGLVGYAGIALLGSADARESEIRTIAVDPRRRRAGIGTRLFDTLLAEADRHGGPVFLEVRTDNEPAIALYRRYRFDVLGVRKRYYQPSGADAYTMCRPVEPVPLDERSVS